MVIKVEHELHTRRKGRNIGIGGILGLFVALVFGLTVVKVSVLGQIQSLQGYDHAVQDELVPIEEVSQ